YRQAPDVILTTVLFKLPTVAQTMLRKGQLGQLQGRSFTDFTLKNTGVGEFAPFRAAAKVIGRQNLAKLTILKQQVLSGKIAVPDETVGTHPIGTVGSAAKIDPKSLGCTPGKY